MTLPGEPIGYVGKSRFCFLSRVALQASRRFRPFVIRAELPAAVEKSHAARTGSNVSWHWPFVADAERAGILRRKALRCRTGYSRIFKRRPEARQLQFLRRDLF